MGGANKQKLKTIKNTRRFLYFKLRSLPWLRTRAFLAFTKYFKIGAPSCIDFCFYLLMFVETIWVRKQCKVMLQEPPPNSRESAWSAWRAKESTHVSVCVVGQVWLRSNKRAARNNALKKLTLAMLGTLSEKRPSPQIAAKNSTHQIISKLDLATNPKNN